MKLVIKLIVGLFLGTVIVCHGQTATNNPTVQSGLQEIVDAVKSGNTNWYGEVHGLYAPKLAKGEQYGGGVGLYWPLSTYVVTGVRAEYLQKDFWMPLGNATLQLPVQVTTWLRLVPFGYLGVGVPVQGAGSQNGSAVAITGLGLAVRLYSPKTSGWYLDLVADQETWAGFAGKQYRVGLLLNKSF